MDLVFALGAALRPRCFYLFIYLSIDLSIYSFIFHMSLHMESFLSSFFFTRIRSINLL